MASRSPQQKKRKICPKSNSGKDDAIRKRILHNFREIKKQLLVKESDLLDIMISKEHLSNDDSECICALETKLERADKFLQIVLREEPPVLKDFLGALSTSHPNVKTLLSRQPEELPCLNADMRATVASERLKAHHNLLLDEINTRDVVDFFLEFEEFDLDEHEAVFVEKTRKGKTSKFLQTLKNERHLARGYSILEYALNQTKESRGKYTKLLHVLRSPLQDHASSETSVEVKSIEEELQQPLCEKASQYLIGIEISGQPGTSDVNIQKVLDHLQQNKSVKSKILFASKLCSIQTGAKDGSIILQLKTYGGQAMAKLQMLHQSRAIGEIIKQILQDKELLSQLIEGVKTLKLTIKYQPLTTGNPKWKEIIMENYDFLVDELDVTDMREWFRQKGTFASEFFETLYKRNTLRKHLAVGFLDQLLRQKEKQKYADFLDCLKETGYNYITTKLGDWDITLDTDEAAEELDPSTLQIVYTGYFEVEISKPDTPTAKMSTALAERQPAISNDDNDDSLEFIQKGDGTLVIRKYQRELAKQALDGKNTIICAEQWAGKSFVMILILQNHLKSNEPERKVAVLSASPRRIRVLHKRIKTYLGRDYKVSLITSENRLNSETTQEDNDSVVICCSPSTVLEQHIPLDFTMVVVDDYFHGCEDGHFSTLLRKLLIRQRNKPLHDRTQIVGMTDSLGVGLTQSAEYAVSKILHTCVMLDVTELSFVRENKEELERHTHLPDTAKLKLAPTILSDVIQSALLETVRIIEDNTSLKWLWWHEWFWFEDLGHKHDLIEELLEAVHRRNTAKKRASDQEFMAELNRLTKFVQVFRDALEVVQLCGQQSVIEFLTSVCTESKVSSVNEAELIDFVKDTIRKMKDQQSTLEVQQRTAETGQNCNLEMLSSALQERLEAAGSNGNALVLLTSKTACHITTKFLEGKLKTVAIKDLSLKNIDDFTAENKDTRNVVLVSTSAQVRHFDLPKCNTLLAYNYSENVLTCLSLKVGDTEDTEEMPKELDVLKTYKAVRMYQAIDAWNRRNIQERQQKIKELQEQICRQSV